MTEYWLHYVGAGLYNVSRFEAEATRMGVQRTVSFNMLGSLKFGDQILLAHWMGNRQRQAEVFGYFVVSGVSDNLPREVTERLWGTLDVVQVVEGGGSEKRACGSYAVGSTAVVRDSIAEIVGKVREVCGEMGVDPTKFKWFLRGEYGRVGSFVLDPAKFTASYMKVDVDGLDLEAPPKGDHLLVWLYDYEQRRYLRKLDKSRMDAASECRPLGEC